MWPASLMPRAVFAVVIPASRERGRRIGGRARPEEGDLPRARETFTDDLLGGVDAERPGIGEAWERREGSRPGESFALASPAPHPNRRAREKMRLLFRKNGCMRFPPPGVSSGYM